MSEDKFQEMITSTCDCLETFVGVNQMTHRMFGEWVFNIQQIKIDKLQSRIKELEEKIKALELEQVRHIEILTEELKRNLEVKSE